MERLPLARSLLAGLLLAGLAVTVVAHHVHFERPALQGPENGDLYRYIYPTAAFLQRELGRGELPLWNPFQYAGLPALAAPNAQMLYPPHLALLSVLPVATALEVEFVLHLWLAGWFTWLFAGRLGLSPPARLAASLGYLFAGPLFFGFYATPLICTEAWLPAILWCVHGLASEPRVRWALALAACLALAFLAGYPQGFAYEVQIGAAYGAFALFTLAPPAARRQVLGLAALAGALALGWIAPQLLPSLELTAQGSRSLAGHTFEQAAAGAIPPDRLLRGLIGALAPEDPALPPGPIRRYVTLPVLALPLAACGLLARRQRAHWAFFLGAAVLAALFLLGDRSPVFRVYYALPLGSLFRIPSRMAFAYSFFVAILVGIGVHGVTSLARRRLPARAAGAVPALLILAIAVDGYARIELPLTHPVLSDPGPGGPEELVQRVRERPGRYRIFIEKPTAHTVDPTLLYRVGTLSEVFAVPDYEPLLPAAYLHYFERESKPLLHGYVSVLPRGLGRPGPSLARRLDLMSVRYYALPNGRAGDLEGLQQFVGGTPEAAGGVPWIERASARPRAYAVRRYRQAFSSEEALERIASAAFRPDREAVVELPPRGEPLAPLSPAGVRSGRVRDRAEIVSYAADSVAIEAECGADCLLILTDLHYPGWRAWADGRETPVHRVNGLFRGVRLEPGTHRVEYRFEPASWRIGWALFLASCLGAVLTFAGPALLRRSARRPQSGQSSVSG